jgi:hypothetical protein
MFRKQANVGHRQVPAISHAAGGGLASRFQSSRAPANTPESVLMEINQFSASVYHKGKIAGGTFSGFTTYLIFYRADCGVVEIIRVLHGARDIPAALLLPSRRLVFCSCRCVASDDYSHAVRSAGFTLHHAASTSSDRPKLGLFLCHRPRVRLVCSGRLPGCACPGLAARERQCLAPS